jgi:hypothetical protein
MRKVITGAFVSLDGVMQAPGGPKEDPTRGFKLTTFCSRSTSSLGIPSALFSRVQMSSILITRRKGGKFEGMCRLGHRQGLAPVVNMRSEVGSSFCCRAVGRQFSFGLA